MGSSLVENICPIIKAVKELTPKTILDYGMGYGKYGFLLREYLDIINDRLSKKEWQVTIDGIDAFSSYLSPAQGYIYNSISVFSDFIEGKKYDVVLFIDVIEHMEKWRGKILLDKLLKICKWLIISTPSAWSPEFSINPYDTHRELWSIEDFKEYEYEKIIDTVGIVLRIKGKME